MALLPEVRPQPSKYDPANTVVATVVMEVSVTPNGTLSVNHGMDLYGDLARHVAFLDTDEAVAVHKAREDMALAIGEIVEFVRSGGRITSGQAN